MTRPSFAAVWRGRFARIGDGFAAPFLAFGRFANRQLAGLGCDHNWRYSKSRGRSVCRYCGSTRRI